MQQNSSHSNGIPITATTRLVALLIVSVVADQVSNTSRWHFWSPTSDDRLAAVALRLVWAEALRINASAAQEDEAEGLKLGKSARQ